MRSKREQLVPWNSVVHEGISIVDCTDDNAGRARYTSSPKLLIEKFRRKERLYLPSRKRASIDKWLEWISTFLGMDEDYKYRTEIPTTDGQMLHIINGFITLTDQNDMDYPTGKLQDSSKYQRDLRR